MSKIYILFILIASLVQVPKARAISFDSTKHSFRLSIEFGSYSRFYDLKSINKYAVYFRDRPGLSYGVQLKLNIKRGFYFAIGSFYTKSTFTFDTVGYFPSGAIFAAPLVLSKKFAYLDQVLSIGKDIQIKPTPIKIGVSIGIAKGRLVEGKKYLMSYYASPTPWADNNKQFVTNPTSLMFGVNTSYILSDRIGFTAILYHRRYNPIENLSGKVSPAEEKALHKHLWNFGIGIQYNFFAGEKVKKWCKKNGSTL